MKENITLLFLILMLPFLCLAQKTELKKGNKNFEIGNYEKALVHYNNYKKTDSKKDVLLKKIICNYKTNNIAAAKSDISKILKFKKTPYESYFYIGKIFQVEGDYEQAISYYKNYLRLLSIRSDERDLVVHLIKQCGLATRIKHIEPRAFVENYGENVNTKYDDFSFIPSPNHSNKYYFSSDRMGSVGGLRDEEGHVDLEYGNYNSDIYSIESYNGSWQNALPINDFLNSSRNEILMDISDQGGVVVYLKGASRTHGTLLTDTFSNNEIKVEPSRFSGPINAEAGDSYFHFYNDSTIIFSSRRLGGYGGYDLYVTTKRNGIWSQAINLGSAVNSPYDEITPFLTNDGSTLYFSTNSVYSLGGFDIFESKYNFKTNEWLTPNNIGQPINSPKNDYYFYIAKDGYSAYLSSDRPNGEGGLDLYAVYFKKQQTGQLANNIELPFLKNEINTNIDNELVQGSTENVLVENPILDKDPKDNPDVIIQEFNIKPIYYPAQGDVITASNQFEYGSISNLLLTFPEIDLTIKAYTVEEGLKAYDLYYTLKKAEEVENYLISKGVSPQQINIKAFGSSRPYAKVNDRVSQNTLIDKVNRRFEFEFHQRTDLPVHVNLESPVLASHLQDVGSKEKRELEKGLCYRIEIAKTTQLFQNEVLNKYDDVLLEKIKGNNTYRYNLGLFKKYSIASNFVNSLKNYQINSTLVIPYIDGKRIDQNSIIDYAKTYPDLINYLKYNE